MTPVEETERGKRRGTISVCGLKRVTPSSGRVQVYREGVSAMEQMSWSQRLRVQSHLPFLFGVFFFFAQVEDVGGDKYFGLFKFYLFKFT